MKTIPLTQGQVALVDDEDYDAISQFKWFANKSRGTFYASRKIKKENGSWTTLHLHRFLLPGPLKVDHEDGNGLNNQRFNLRNATNAQNQQAFRRKKRGATSKFRGVSRNFRDANWRTFINVSRKTISLGTFKTEREAALAYDQAALKFFGKFAQSNFQ